MYAAQLFGRLVARATRGAVIFAQSQSRTVVLILIEDTAIPDIIVQGDIQRTRRVCLIADWEEESVIYSVVESGRN